MDSYRVLRNPSVNQAALEARSRLTLDEQSLFQGTLAFVLETTDIDTFSAPGFRNDPTALEIQFATGAAKGIAQALFENRGTN